MDELKLMAAAIAGTIEDCMRELNKLDLLKQEKEYTHKLGEISAYNDVLNMVINMVIWRMNQLEKKGK